MKAVLWLVLIWLAVPYSFALQFAVSPPQLVLDNSGNGELIIMNPSDVAVWYEVLGTNQSGMLNAFEQKNLALYPQEEFVSIHFRDAANNWIVSEIAVPVIRQDNISSLVIILLVIAMIVVVVIGSRAVLIIKTRYA